MAGEKGLFEVLKLGLNLNGDLPDKELISIAKECEKLGILVWIGDNELFKDPFYVADLIADYTSYIGFGVVTINWGCKTIFERIKELIDEHKDTVFLLGIGAGRFDNPKFALIKTLECLRFLRQNLEIPLFCGCSSPIITKESSKVVDGILFNYGYPDYVAWISSFLSRDIYKIAYAPALILPSDFEEDLLIACSIVSCSSKRFVKEFGYEDMCKVFSSLDFRDIIIKRKRREQLDPRILKFRDLLIDRFAIAGSLEDVCNRIRSLLELCDHVVLGDPFFRDKNSLKQLKHLQANVLTSV